MGKGIINHPGHNHPLRQEWNMTTGLGQHKCSGCNQWLEGEGSSSISYCQEEEGVEVSSCIFYCQEEEGCEYFLHSWCARLGYMDDHYSDQIDHPLHPQHPLTLHFTTSYPPSPDDDDNNNNNNGRQTQTTDDHQYFVCSFCKKTRTSGFLLHCASCNFYLDFVCATRFEDEKQLLSQYEVQHFLLKKHTLLPHRCPLSFCPGVSPPRYCEGCHIGIHEDDLVFKCSARECEDYYLHVGCFRLPEEMKHPFHPQHTLTLVRMSFTSGGEEVVASRKYLRSFFKDMLRCSACQNEIFDGAFLLNCNQCPLGSFALDMQCAFLNPTVKYDCHDHHLLAHYNVIDVQDALCAACNTPCLRNLYRCFACNFNIHKACLSLPTVVNFEDHVHPFTLVNSLDEDPSGTYYCDVCEEKREPNHGLYSCQECGSSFVAHFECVLSPSYTKGNKPWMRQKFRREDEELTSDEKQLVSQLDEKTANMRNIVTELCGERVLREKATPKLDELEECNAEAEDLIRQLRKLINSINIAN